MNDTQQWDNDTRGNETEFTQEDVHVFKQSALMMFVPVLLIAFVVIGTHFYLHVQHKKRQRFIAEQEAASEMQMLDGSRN